MSSQNEKQRGYRGVIVIDADHFTEIEKNPQAFIDLLKPKINGTNEIEDEEFFPGAWFAGCHHYSEINIMAFDGGVPHKIGKIEGKEAVETIVQRDNNHKLTPKSSLDMLSKIFKQIVSIVPSGVMFRRDGE